MSDHNKINGQALDRCITGNYGEDQFKNKNTDLELLAKEIWEVWIEKHKELYPEIWAGAHPVQPPTWDGMNNKVKQCWFAAAKYVMDEYIS